MGKSASKGLRILVTNDDGIHAPGLKVLEKIAQADARRLDRRAGGGAERLGAFAVAGKSVARPQLTARKYAIKGTPSDCVLMAVRHIMKDEAPDLILSGVNRGQNIADDVTYSGTIAAAMEGTQLGIRRSRSARPSVSAVT